MAKGKKFENSILNDLNKLSKQGKGYFIKSPTPINRIKTENGYKMVYSSKALCDFIGIWNEKFVLIEAKEVSGTRFDMKRLKDHQVKQLSSIKRHGGFGFIAFNIKQEKEIYITPIENYLVHKNQTTKKSINLESLKEISFIFEDSWEFMLNKITIK